MIKDVFEGKMDESSMSRLWRKFNDHEAAIITAYRGEYTKSQNQQRNRKLYATLSKYGYSVTSVDGGYVEVDNDGDKQEVAEHSFVVVNHKDDSGFENKIIALGEYFDQDSVLIINGGEATLVGTTKRDGADPKYGQRVKFNNRRINPADPMFFTRLGNSKMMFEMKTREERLQDIYHKPSFTQNMMDNKYANEVISELNKM